MGVKSNKDYTMKENINTEKENMLDLKMSLNIKCHVRLPKISLKKIFDYLFKSSIKKIIIMLQSAIE